MSNAERAKNLPQILQAVEPKFTELAKLHGVPDFTFAREAAFALQILKENEYLAGIAFSNQDSLKEAIINVAATGLTLSPVHKLAYLVPRKKKVCLDISYQGFIHLATSKNVLQWVKAEIVHDGDEFEYQGVNREPIHKFNPFKDRGAMVGGYTLARTPGGDTLVDFMKLDEIHAIRNRSEAWKAFLEKKVSTTPWKTDEGEMIKKTLIRRAYKSWPKHAAKVLDEAVTVSDEADGIDFKSEQALPPPSVAPKKIKDSPQAKIRRLLKKLKRDETAYISYLIRIHNRDLKKLEDLTEIEANQAIVFLSGLADAQTKRETTHENVG